jgi:hypothetical protein
MFRPYQLTHKVELPLLFIGENQEFLEKFKDNLKELGYEVNSERYGKENEYGGHIVFRGLETIVANKGKAVITLNAKEDFHRGGPFNLDLKEIGFNEQAAKDLSATLLAYLKSERERNERVVKGTEPKPYRNLYAKKVREIDKSIKMLSQYHFV